MKIKTLYEASLFDGSELITEDMLTESFIEDTLKPKLIQLLSKKAQRLEADKRKFEQTLQMYARELTAMGINGNEAREIATRKARAVTPANFKQMVARQFSEMIDEIKQGGIASITKTMLTILAIIFIQSVMMQIFFVASSGNPILSMALLAMFVAPIVEETGRWISIKSGKGGQFTLLFNIAEYTTYMLQAPMMGISLSTMAIVRIIPVIGHTLLSIIMRSGVQSGNTILPQAMTLHAVYNATAMLPAFLTSAVSASPLPVVVTGIGAMLLSKTKIINKSQANEGVRMYVYGYTGARDEQEIRIEIVTKSPNLIMVQQGIDAAFMESYASKIAAEVIYWTDFEEVKRIYNQNKDTKMAVIIDDELLSSTIIMGGGPIKRWLRKSIYIRIVRSKKAEMEA
jgi:hypothetical protein